MSEHKNIENERPIVIAASVVKELGLGPILEKQKELDYANKCLAFAEVEKCKVTCQKSGMQHQIEMDKVGIDYLEAENNRLRQRVAQLESDVEKVEIMLKRFCNVMM